MIPVLATDALGIAALTVSAVSAAGVVYSVVVSRQALEWQRRRDAERGTPQIRVEFEHASTPMRLGFDVLDDSDPRPMPLFYELTVSVVNVGETTEHVKTLWIEQADREAGTDLSDQLRGDRELKPRSRVTATTELAHIPQWHRGFVGIARLAGGQEIVSPVEHAIDDLVQKVEEHNRRART